MSNPTWMIMRTFGALRVTGVGATRAEAEIDYAENLNAHAKHLADQVEELKETLRDLLSERPE
jgi:hypothetical protein